MEKTSSWKSKFKLDTMVLNSSYNSNSKFCVFHSGRHTRGIIMKHKQPPAAEFAVFYSNELLSINLSIKCSPEIFAESSNFPEPGQKTTCMWLGREMLACKLVLHFIFEISDKTEHSRSTSPWQVTFRLQLVIAHCGIRVTSASVSSAYQQCWQNWHHGVLYGWHHRSSTMKFSLAQAKTPLDNG